MPISRINFTQNYGQIAIRGIENARMQIDTPGGQMTINQNRTQLQIDTQLPTFRVPRERLRRESGLASPLDFAKSFRDKGKRAALKAAADYKNDGNYMANPNIPGDKAAPRVAANRMKRALAQPEKNIGLMPSSPPSLDWTKGHININVSRHNIAVDWNGSNTATITSQPNYPVQVSLMGQTDYNLHSVVPNIEKRTTGYYFDRMV